VQQVKIFLIERAAALGRLDRTKLFRTAFDEATWIMQRDWEATLGRWQPKCVVDPLPPMPEEEPQRTAEAVQRVMPDLLRLQRYQARAVARRDGAFYGLALKISD